MPRTLPGCWPLLRTLAVLLFAFSFLLASFSAQAMPWKKAPPVSAELIADQAGAQPGGELTLGILLKHSEGWHTYWKSPGETGIATDVQWSLPQGWSAGEIQWITPKKFVTSGIVNYGYDREVLLPVRIRVSEDAKPGTQARIEADASWLMCAEQCVPGSAHVSLQLPILQAKPQPSSSSALFAKTLSLVPREIRGVKATLDPENFLVRFSFPPLEPFKDFYIFAEGADAVVYKAGQSFSKQKESAEFTLQGTNLLKPGDTFRGVISADGGPQHSGWSRSFSAVLEKGLIRPTQNQALLYFGAPSSRASSLTLWASLFTAFLGGLILNLMPCVFPVLSLKMLHLAQTRHRADSLLKGLFFTLGVLFSMLTLSLLLVALKNAGAALGWGFQLQSPWFVSSLVLLFAALTLNLAGVFEFSGPAVRQNSDDSGISSFATGVLAVVVATPCSAPFMGAALGYALSAAAPEAACIFLSLGIGLSAPWLILSAFPVLVSWLPKPGKWMVIFKKVMAAPMALTALWLFWVLSRQVSEAALTSFGLSVLLLCLFLALYGRKQFGLRTPTLLLALTGALCAGFYALPLFVEEKTDSQNEENRHQQWSSQKVEAALAAGRPVFVDFTASWCVTCQANKAMVLDTPEIRRVMAENNIELLIADWTNRNPLITEALASFNRSGVPLYVLYRPSGEIKVLPELLTKDIVIRAINNNN